MRSSSPARRSSAASLRRSVHEDDRTAEGGQPGAALLKMARRHAYEDDPTVSAYVDAQEEDFVVPCVHTAPAPGTMPVLSRDLVSRIERAWAPSSGYETPAYDYPPPPASRVASRQAPYPSAPWSVASGAYAPSHHGSYAGSHPGVYTGSYPGVYTGSYGGVAMQAPVAASPTRARGDLVRNMAAVCVGLLAALAIGTAAVVLAASGKPAGTGTNAVPVGAPPAAVVAPARAVPGPQRATPAAQAPAPAQPTAMQLHAQAVHAAEAQAAFATHAARTANAARAQAAQAEANAAQAQAQAQAAEVQAMEAAQTAQQRVAHAQAAQAQAAQLQVHAVQAAQEAQAAQQAHAVRAAQMQAAQVQAPAAAPPAPVHVAPAVSARRAAVAAPARPATVASNGSKPSDDERALALEALRAAGEHPTL